MPESVLDTKPSQAAEESPPLFREVLPRNIRRPVGSAELVLEIPEQVDPATFNDICNKAIRTFRKQAAWVVWNELKDSASTIQEMRKAKFCAQTIAYAIDEFANNAVQHDLLRIQSGELRNAIHRTYGDELIRTMEKVLASADEMRGKKITLRVIAKSGEISLIVEGLDFPNFDAVIERAANRKEYLDARNTGTEENWGRGFAAIRSIFNGPYCYEKGKVPHSDRVELTKDLTGILLLPVP